MQRHTNQGRRPRRNRGPRECRDPEDHVADPSDLVNDFFEMVDDQRYGDFVFLKMLDARVDSGVGKPISRAVTASVKTVASVELDNNFSVQRVIALQLPPVDERLMFEHNAADIFGNAANEDEDDE